MTQRRIFSITGKDSRDFLQGLITNDIAKVDSGLLYAAMLTPQGKYIADFFLFVQDGDLHLDADAAQADALVQRLSMYKLRADVTISEAALHVHRGTEACPVDGFPDPRHPKMGWRAYRGTPGVENNTEWAARQVAYLIPQSGLDLTPDTFILEAGFERLNGVDFRKGCYVGQEVTARMKHKTELRKGLAQVTVQGVAPPGTQIMANGKPAGKILSRAADLAIAYLRFDRATGPMTADQATVTWIET